MTTITDHRVTELRVREDFAGYIDELFAADPALIIAASELKRRFRADNAASYADAHYRSAYSPAALSRMLNALAGDEAVGEDGPVGTYRIVNHSGRTMLRLEQQPTAAAIRARNYRARKAIGDLPTWLHARKAARTEPESIDDTLAAWEAERGTLSDSAYIDAEETIDALYSDWETNA